MTICVISISTINDNNQLGVNFRSGFPLPGYLEMRECGSNGTLVPWFYQWKSAGKNPGYYSFASPKYLAISSPFSWLRDVNNITANSCYYSNLANAGILAPKTCADTQELTWFGYATPNVPANIPKTTVWETPCRLLETNTNPLLQTCVRQLGGFDIKPLSGTDGRLLTSGTGVKAANGLAVMRSGYYFKLTFSIRAFKASGKIAEVILNDSDSGTRLARIEIDLATGTAKIQIKITNLNPSSPFIMNPSIPMISSQNLMLGRLQPFAIEIRFDSASVRIKQDGQIVSQAAVALGLGKKQLQASFSSPPM